MHYHGHHTSYPRYNRRTGEYDGEYSHVHFWHNHTHGDEFVVECEA